MNWQSKSISEVAKEKIWKEHVENERAHMHIFDQFRKNPFRVAKDKPLPDSVNRRDTRFLDRERSFLETIERRVAQNQKQTQLSSNNNATQLAQDATVALPPLKTSAVPNPPPAPATTTTNNSTDKTDFGAMWSKMQSLPSQRYVTPMTESHELGWFQPEPRPRNDRFNYNHRSTEMTRFAQSLARSKPPKS